jgi:hypothetical protein
LYVDIPGLIGEYEDVERFQPVILENRKVKSKVFHRCQYKNGKVVNEPLVEFYKRFPSLVDEFESNALWQNRTALIGSSVQCFPIKLTKLY